MELNFIIYSYALSYNAKLNNISVSEGIMR